MSLHYRTGCIYSEIYNKGNQKRGKRYVGEIMIAGKRRRLRSHEYSKVQNFINAMVDQFPHYNIGRK